MKRCLLFSVVAVVLLAGCASMKPSVARGNAAQVTVVVVAQSPLQQSDADLFVRVLQDYLQRYVHDGKTPLSLTLKLDRYELGASAYNDVSSNGYGDIEWATSDPSSKGRVVPQVLGTPIQAPHGVGPVNYLVATYTISDAAGKSVESRRFPLYPMSFLWQPNTQLAERTQALHDAASFLAQRVAQVQ